MRPRAPDPASLARRRERLLAELGEDAALVLPAAPELVIGRDREVPYVPDPDLWYLTGLAEPGAVAVFRPGADATFHLFARPADAERALWTGPRPDLDQLRERAGADAVDDVGQLRSRLPPLLRGVDRVYFRLGTGRDDVEGLVLEALRRGPAERQRSGRGPVQLADPGLLLDGMRLVKDPAEVQAIRDAVRVSIDAFRSALPLARAGTGEWVVEAAVDAAFRRAGADGPAFPTIVASGPGATVLHYTANDRVMEDGDLLLLDAGARLHGYHADLTRTVPVGGRFSGPGAAARADVVALVLEAERAAIAAVRPGAPADQVHRAAVEVLVRGMVELGLLAGDAAALVEDPDAWKPWFPHRTSHWLGLDVHDVGAYVVDGRPRTLEPGMVLTVEPGLYIPATGPAAERAPAALRGVGVRIEDDVLVTPAGHEVLSADLPTDPEALVGG